MNALAKDVLGSALADPRTYMDRAVYNAVTTQLRREDPVHWSTPDGFRPFWAITKHADIAEIETQPDVFVSGPRLELFSVEQERKIQEATGRTHAVGKTLLHMDGAEHRAYRGASQAWFMPKNLRNLEQQIDQLARASIDRMADAGGSIDFVKGVSDTFPLTVILAIIGLPASEAPKLLQLTRNFNGREVMPVPPGKTREDLIVQYAQEIFDYFNSVYEERLRQPRDDVASVISNAKINGEPIGRAEVLSYLLLLGLAGHDTTNSTMSGGLLALIQNPGEYAKLRANLDLIPSAVDEIIRWVTPVNCFMRTATRDYQLRGRNIKQGESVLLLYGSANRDEEVFPDPFTFKVDRKPNNQLAFGYGAHLCLGQHVAKMELRSFFRELVSRVEHIELAAEPTMGAIVTAYQILNLPIRYRMNPIAA